jgi:hypothetical protein
MNTQSLTLAFLMTALPLSLSAQVNPYAPPFPGAVLVQPCGETEPGWVPPDHPLAQPLDRFCQPSAPAPDTTRPWTLAPTEPMELGHAYRDPYGLVVFVVRIESRLVWDTVTAQYRVVWSGDVMQYQTEEQWRADQGGRLGWFDPTAPRDVRWEVTR